MWSLIGKVLLSAERHITIGVMCYEASVELEALFPKGRVEYLQMGSGAGKCPANGGGPFSVPRLQGTHRVICTSRAENLISVWAPYQGTVAVCRDNDLILQGIKSGRGM